MVLCIIIFFFESSTHIRVPELRSSEDTVEMYGEDNGDSASHIGDDVDSILDETDNLDDMPFEDDDSDEEA